MNENETFRGLHRRSLLLGGAGLGAGLVTSSAAARLPGSGGRDAHHASVERHLHRTRTPRTGTTCPSRCRGARGRSTCATASSRTTPASASAPTSSTSASSTRRVGGWATPPGSAAGRAARGATSGSPVAGRRPGYLAGPLTPGRWHVILGPVPDHAAGNAVDGQGDASSTATRWSRRSRRATRRRRSPGTGAGWYRGDLHLHSELLRRAVDARPAGRRRRRPRASTSSAPPSTTPTPPPGCWGRHVGRRLPGGQRRGGHHPQRPLARDRDQARRVDRLALPGGRRTS